jgi:hypothetical protein
MHHVELTLDVHGEPKVVLAAKDIAGDVEVISTISDFLARFVTPDRGAQEIRITIASHP